MMTHDDRGEGGVKNCQNGGDVICGCPLILQKFLTIAKWPRLTFFRGHKSSKNGTSTQRASGVNAVLSQLQGQSKVWQKNGRYISLSHSHKTLGTTPH